MKQPVNEDGIEEIDYIECKICGEKFNQLNHRHLQKHGLTSNEYKKKHNISRLTAENYSQKREQTFIKRCGVKNQFGRNDIVIDREKQIDNTKKVMIEKYGVENPLQVPEFREKIKKFNMKKYGYTCNLAYQNKQKMIEKYSKKLGTNDLKEINEYRKIERKLHNNFSWFSNKSGKTNKTFKLLPYTKDELINHLKSTMPTGYNWSDYLNGTLEVDHIIPRNLYVVKNTNDKEFKKCWDLKNLRLLHHKENASKKDNLDWKLVEQYNIKHLLPNYFLSEVL